MARTSAAKTSPARTSARGFTLLELMLVLAIVVAAASIAIPMVAGPLEGQRLLKAGDQVRAAWNRARVTAMRTGRIHAFRFQLQTNLYVIEPVASPEDYLESGVQQFGPGGLAAGPQQPVPPFAAAQGPAGMSADGLLQPKEIGDNVVFVNVASQIDLRSSRVLEQMQNAGDMGAISEPILFYPDGTSSTAQLLLSNDRQEDFVVVKLRGLTGMAYVSSLLTAEELPQ